MRTKILSWIRKIISLLHGYFFHNRRVVVLADFLTPYVIPVNGLDVGAGDGRLCRMIAQKKPDIFIQGIELPGRKNIPEDILIFDGKSLPVQDESFDFILLVDVIHHATDIDSLLSECRRVTSKRVIIKDHICRNKWDNIRLRFMDWIGNCNFGVNLHCRYFSFKEWDELIKKHGFYLHTHTIIPLYPFPISLLAGGHLQIILVLEKLKSTGIN